MLLADPAANMRGMLRTEDYLDPKQFAFPELLGGSDNIWDALKKLPAFAKHRIKPSGQETRIGSPYVPDDAMIGKGTVVEHGAVIYWVLAIFAVVVIGFCYVSAYMAQQLAARMEPRRLQVVRKIQALPHASAAPVAGGSALLGTKPVERTVSEWLNNEPLTLAVLRGKIVLVRW
jgi:hypothetical protein